MPAHTKKKDGVSMTTSPMKYPYVVSHEWSLAGDRIEMTIDEAAREVRWSATLHGRPCQGLHRLNARDVDALQVEQPVGTRAATKGSRSWDLANLIRVEHRAR